MKIFGNRNYKSMTLKIGILSHYKVKIKQNCDVKYENK